MNQDRERPVHDDHVRITRPEPGLYLVALSPRLALRVKVVEGSTVASWCLDGAPLGASRPSATA